MLLEVDLAELAVDSCELICGDLSAVEVLAQRARDVLVRGLLRPLARRLLDERVYGKLWRLGGLQSLELRVFGADLALRVLFDCAEDDLEVFGELQLSGDLVGRVDLLRVVLENGVDDIDSRILLLLHVDLWGLRLLVVTVLVVL